MNIARELVKLLNVLLSNPLAFIGLAVWVLLVLVERKIVDVAYHPITAFDKTAQAESIWKKISSTLAQSITKVEILGGLGLAAFIHRKNPFLTVINVGLGFFVFFLNAVGTTLHIALIVVVIFEIAYFSVTDLQLRVVLLLSLAVALYAVANAVGAPPA